MTTSGEERLDPNIDQDAQTYPFSLLQKGPTTPRDGLVQKKKIMPRDGIYTKAQKEKMAKEDKKAHGSKPNGKESSTKGSNGTAIIELGRSKSTRSLEQSGVADDGDGGTGVCCNKVKRRPWKEFHDS